MPASEVTVVKPNVGKDATVVRARPGTTVELKADPAPPDGEWRRDDTPVLQSAGAANGQLLVVLARDGSTSGRYDYLTAAGRSNAVEVGVQLNVLTRLLRHGLGAILATAAYGLLMVMLLSRRVVDWSDTSAALTTRSYLAAGLTMLWGVLLLYLAGRAATTSAGPGLAFLIQGADRRASTSKVQYLLWTFGVGFALSYIAARTAMSADNFTCSTTATGQHANCVPTESWDAYLILLGVPAAAAVIAKGVTSAKVADGTLQKTEGDGASPADVVTDDNGRADLADVQYLLFNVVTFVFVAAHFVHRGVLVDVPAILLGLTSAAAATYVLNKSVQTNKPIIASVSPSVVAPGTTVTIRGRNLFPAGAQDTVDVTIGGVPTTGTRNGDDVVATAPPGMSSTDAGVTVTTAAKVATEKYPITVLDALTVIGSVGGQPAGGRQLQLRVDGLPTGSGKIWVTFGSQAVEGQYADGIVTVQAPALPAGTNAVKVGQSGRWSPATQLTFT